MDLFTKYDISLIGKILKETEMAEIKHKITLSNILSGFGPDLYTYNELEKYINPKRALEEAMFGKLSRRRH
jgi:hypothetical protein